MAQPRAHAGARRHSRFSPRSSLHRDQRHAGVLQPVRSGQPGGARRQGLPRSPQCADANGRSAWCRHSATWLARSAAWRSPAAWAAAASSCTMRFDIDAARRAAAIEALTTRVLPPLVACAKALPECTCALPTRRSATSRPRRRRRAPTRRLVPTLDRADRGIARGRSAGGGEVLETALQRARAPARSNPRPTGTNSRGSRRRRARG